MKTSQEKLEPIKQTTSPRQTETMGREKPAEEQVVKAEEKKEVEATAPVEKEQDPKLEEHKAEVQA